MKIFKLMLLSVAMMATLANIFAAEKSEDFYEDDTSRLLSSAGKPTAAGFREMAIISLQKRGETAYTEEDITTEISVFKRAMDEHARAEDQRLEDYGHDDDRKYERWGAIAFFCRRTGSTGTAS